MKKAVKRKPSGNMFPRGKFRQEGEIPSPSGLLLKDVEQDDQHPCLLIQCIGYTTDMFDFKY